MLEERKSTLLAILFLCLLAFLPRLASAATKEQETTQTVGREKADKPRAAKSVVYTNKKYRFRFSLPESWRGYSIVVTEWEGGDGGTYQAGEPVPPPEKGTLILIGHPLSTKSNPRQAIPIMIFTKAQWELVEADKLILSAGPMGPSELGRNAKYVFALPPRFDYADIDGRQDVDEILQHHPLHPFWAPPAAEPNSDLNSVVYTVTGLTFPGAGPQHTESFQFTAPNFITSSISLSESRLDSCANCIQSGTAVQFFPNGTLPLIVPADSVHFTDADGIVYGWVFAPGAFSATGTYTAFDYPPYIVSDVATMTVRAIWATPETTSKRRSVRCLYLWKCGIRAKAASRTAGP